MDVEESLQRASELHEEQGQEQPQPSEHESFDAFWQSLTPSEERTETICGVTVTVPTSERMTLRFRRELERLDMHGRETTDEEMRTVVSDLFGADVLDRWTDAGMTEQQLAVVMAWGIACASGKEMTWREAYAAVVEGKAPDRLKQKNPTSNGASRNSGGRSKGGQRRKGSKRKN